MNTHEHLSELISYNEWANARTAESVTNANSRRSSEILSHIVTTEQEYLERFKGKDSAGFNFWPDMRVADCESLNRENAKRYKKLISEAGEYGLDHVLEYKNSRGEEYRNTIRELITHVLIHSAIHRGNIILKLREEGFEPPQTDNLIYLRETKGQ